MRKLYSFNMMTLDGFFEGAHQDISWHNTDDEFNAFAIAQLREIGTLVFGRVTYQMMARYWPTPAAVQDDAEVAGMMNHTPKVVVSRTLDKAEWENSQLVRDHVERELARLKQQPGKDIAVFGSANLLDSLTRAGLVDEHRVMVNPVILGQGTPLFKQSQDKTALQLVQARTFGNGNVLLTYRPR